MTTRYAITTTVHLTYVLIKLHIPLIIRILYPPVTITLVVSQFNRPAKNTNPAQTSEDQWIC